MGSKKKKEEPVSLSAPLAYMTAVELLYVARKLALERKDVTSLIDISNSWVEIGNHLLTFEIELEYNGSDDEVQDNDQDVPFVVGFSGGIENDRKEEVDTSPDAPED
jgi:hypothetical protein